MISPCGIFVWAKRKLLLTGKTIFDHQDLEIFFRICRKFHAISMDEKKRKKDNNNSSTSLSTMLLQGLEAPSKLVRLYQLNSWPQHSTVPESPDVLINLMGDIEEWHDSVRENHMNSDGSSNHPNRIAVVSCDGISRAGVYGAIFTSFEQVNSFAIVFINISTRPFALGCFN